MLFLGIYRDMCRRDASEGPCGSTELPCNISDSIVTPITGQHAKSKGDF